MKPHPRRCHETLARRRRQPSSDIGSPAPFCPRYLVPFPNRFFQKSYESTTTALAPGTWSSSIVNSLPSAGLTPSTEKYVPDTSSASVSLGSPLVERLIVVSARQNTPSKNSFCCWRSRQIGYDIKLSVPMVSAFWKPIQSMRTKRSGGRPEARAERSDQQESK
jgi:hypothetical protein